MSSPNSAPKKRSIAIVVAIGGLLAAVSSLLRFIEAPIPIFPSFLKIDFSNIPALLGGFAMGPWVGLAVLLIKNIVYLPFSSTGGVGEIADFIVSACFILPAVLVYRYNKSFKGALWGMALGTAVMTLLAGPLMNYFVLIPLYRQFMPIDQILQMAALANPNINSVWTYILYAVVPFNLVKSLVVCIVTYLLYKPLSPVLHKYR